jgi:hypothetical protein
VAATATQLTPQEPDEVGHPKSGVLLGSAVEGAADFFFGRPLDANPYARETDAWEAWSFGWLGASWFNRMRGEVERRRWRAVA